MNEEFKSKIKKFCHYVVIVMGNSIDKRLGKWDQAEEFENAFEIVWKARNEE